MSTHLLTALVAILPLIGLNWSNALADLMSVYDLCDAWHVKHPGVLEYSWRRPNGAQGSRIDMIWLPRNLIGDVECIDILPFFRSDHAYLFMKVSFPSVAERSPGLWKFNTSHLEDPEFATQVTAFWSSWQQEISWPEIVYSEYSSPRWYRYIHHPRPSFGLV